jgi:competence protein ComEC
MAPDAGPLAALVALAALVWARLAHTFEKEMEAGRGFLWLPVAFGAGILAYFALPREPWPPALGVLTLALGLATWRGRFRIALFRLLVVATAVAAGLTAAKFRTDQVAEPTLTGEVMVTATGWIAGLGETAAGGARVYLRVHHIDGIDAGKAPKTVRVTIRSRADRIAVGDAISVLARLTRLSGPIMPGGYDFARAAFYEGIGASGFAYGAAKPAAIGPAPLDIRLGQPLSRLRDTIRRRIEAALPGDAGHVAAALIVGDQGGISEETQQAMRASGLGHILSISGLHMALVAGSTFWLIRALLALSPALALGRPIKKWAAAAALAVATVYLGLSGGGVATERAFIMLTIMLTAIMIDRRAITLRNVALAALVVLVISPEGLLTASFHMSFAATAALISAYEAIAAWSDGRQVLATRHGVDARLRWYAASLLLTSLIAGLATAPFAAFHFQRIAPLTLLANLAAMPAVGLIVMPMALAAVVAMPFGLEALPLTVMKWGLAWVGFVAEKTAAWSAGYGGVAMAPAAALMLIVAGFLWLVLWRERWRLAGLIPMALALPLALAAPQPDILVDEQGAVVAVRGENGRLSILGGRGADFEIAYWLRADADPRLPGDPGLSKGVACDALGCVAKLGGNGGGVALVARPDAFAEDCRLVAVIVSRLDAPPGCESHALVIDRARLDRFGAHALYRHETGLRIETAYPALRRPFMPPAPQQ